MVKKSSIFTSILLGAAGGAAAAAFLATRTGQAVKKKVVNFAKDYQENHEEINAELIQKAQGLGQQAVDKYETVKEQFETGEITVDSLVQSGKEKAQFVKDQSLEKIGQLKDKIAEKNLPAAELVETVKEKAKAISLTEPNVEDLAVTTEDIEIDLPALED